MAHGYPDHWAQATPGLPVPGIEQVVWNDYSLKNILTGATSNLVSFPVPANRVLFIAGGYVTCDFPFLMRCGVYVGPAASLIATFDTSIILPFNPSALIQVNATITVTLTATNLDVAVHRFDGGLYGFLVTLVPGTPPPEGIGLAITGAGA